MFATEPRLQEARAYHEVRDYFNSFFLCLILLCGNLFPKFFENLSGTEDRGVGKAVGERADYEVSAGDRAPEEPEAQLEGELIG